MHPHRANIGTVNAPHSNFNEVHGDQHNHNFSNFNAALEKLASNNVADARYNSRYRSTELCEPGTRTDMLGVAKAWLDTNESSVCWLHGKAGTGKSAIAQTISKLFEESGHLAASFFFSRDNEKCSSIEYIVATIAFQLTGSIPALRDPILNALKDDILDLKIEDQWQKLIVEPLQSLPESNYLQIIVIDALDECSHPDQFKVLVRSTSDPHFPLRFFITSRPEPHILSIFQDAGITPLSYDLQTFVPDGDIQLYLERKLEAIRKKRHGVVADIPSPWPTADNVAAIVKKSSGLFIYASTAVKFIGAKSTSPQNQLEIVLKDGCSMADLDQLYQQVLSAANPDHLRSVIGTILFLRNPLNCKELACLLDIPITTLMLVLEGLHSILSIPEDMNDTRPVTVFHSSLYECLTSKRRVGDFFIDPGINHARLSKSCLNRIKIVSANDSFIVCYPSNYRWIIEERFRLRSDSEKAVIRYACR